MLGTWHVLPFLTGCSYIVPFLRDLCGPQQQRPQHQRQQQQKHWSTDFVTCTVHIKGDAYRNTRLSSLKVSTDEQAGWWSAAGLIRGLSSLDDDRGFKDKFLDGQMEQPVQSEEAQVQLGQHPRVLMVFLSWGCFSVS